MSIHLPLTLWVVSQKVPRSMLRRYRQGNMVKREDLSHSQEANPELPITTRQKETTALSRLVHGIKHEKTVDGEQEETLSHIQQAIDDLRDLNRRNEKRLQELLQMRTELSSQDRIIDSLFAG